ncbi:hypothetical protein ACFZDI_11280 [Streptomyces sp. NPDC007907]|uniref:hypothetical protein n=1 Tax=Streptomyces sp. NPDC007907 TaxID=3364789 RepID=UPI0036EA7686
MTEDHNFTGLAVFGRKGAAGGCPLGRPCDRNSEAVQIAMAVSGMAVALRVIEGGNNSTDGGPPLNCRLVVALRVVSGSQLRGRPGQQRRRRGWRSSSWMTEDRNATTARRQPKP